MTEIYDLPLGWVKTFYGNVYLSASNGTGGKQNKDGIGIPVSRIETIANETIDYSRIGYLADFDQERVEKHILADGDILFSHINSPVHLGKTALYDGKQTLYHGINLLRIVVDRNVILPKLFNYHCNYTRALGHFSQNAQHAVNQSSLNQKKLSSFEIFLPPPAEQKVIADKLDSLLTQVETTKARLDRVPYILKRFRQSVLAAAVSGRLTGEWRKSRGLFLSTWEMKKIEDLSDNVVVGYVGSIKSHLTDEGGVPLLSTTHIQEDGFTWKERRFVTHEFSIKTKKSSVTPGDVLVARHGESGRCCLVPDDYEEYQTSNVVVIKIKDRCLAKYIVLAMNSQRLAMKEHQVGGVLKVVNTKSIAEYKLPTPSPTEQIEIVRRVEELFAFADAIEQKAKAASDRVNKLTQSILAKAFRGELTAYWRATNPDLISGENSAEALLEKIKAEREALKPKKKTRAKKVEV